MEMHYETPRYDDLHEWARLSPPILTPSTLVLESCRGFQERAPFQANNHLAAPQPPPPPRAFVNLLQSLPILFSSLSLSLIFLIYFFFSTLFHALFI